MWLTLINDKHGQVPADRKLAIVVVRHQDGRRSLFYKYWPVGVNCTLFKHLEKLIKRHILRLLKELNLFQNGPHDFLKYRSCPSNMPTFWRR